MKRLAAFLTALILLLPFTATAVTYPARRGAVNDDAGVLSEQTASDIEQLNTLADAADIAFVVATRHFLGGTEAQSYCDQLFSAWNLDKNTVLLLLVIGEERYAVTAGANVISLIGREQINSFLASKLRTPYLNDRDYDGAVGSFLLAMTAQAAKNSGVTVKTSGLFGTAAQSSVQTESAESTKSDSSWYDWTGDWWSGFFSTDDTEYYQNSSLEFLPEKQEHYDNGSGFSIGKLIVIVLILWFILRRRKAKGKNGLGLLGWLVAGKGVSEVMKGMSRGRGPGPNRGPGPGHGPGRGPRH